MKNIYLIIVTSLLALSSCEEPVEIEIEGGQSQITIDAFISDLDETQIIKLSNSKDFFDAVKQTPITGAVVKITDSQGKVYNFTDNNNGDYTWNDSVLVKEGLTYDLSIDYNGEKYTSQELANPAPSIDSLLIELVTGEFGPPSTDTGQYQIELFAKDIAGRDDYYWIRNYRNDTLDTRAGAINVTKNAGSDGSDGLLFIPPVRFFSLNDFSRPYTFGEKTKVQIWSINKNTSLFLSQVSTQVSNGGLFAVPPSNVRTNIESTSTEISKKAIGYFSISMVSEIERTIQ